MDFKDKLMIMYANITFMQQRVINKKVYQDAKIEMLKLYWVQVLGWFVTKSVEIADPQLKFVAANMMSINKDIQDYVLRRLLVQIQKLVGIATYKSRQTKRPNVCDHDQIDI